MRPTGVILIIHSMFPPRLTDAEVLDGLPTELQDLPHRIIRIEPDFGRIESYNHDYDWSRYSRVQEQLYADQLEPALDANPGHLICYFGLAPVPFAFQLGALLPEGFHLRVFQRHHGTKTWSWAELSRDPLPLEAEPSCGTSETFTGDIVVRVGTSHRVTAGHTEDVFSGHVTKVQDFDLQLRSVAEDCFETEAQLEDFCRRFDRLLDSINRGYPRARRIHLFAAVPCGVAFRMGSYFNPMARKPILTYKYAPDGDTSYAPAIAVGYPRDKPRLLLLTADPRGTSPTSGLPEVKAIRSIYEGQEVRMEVHIEPGALASDLDRLFDNSALIVHFAGHGSGAESDVGEDARELDLDAPDDAPGTLVLMNREGRRVDFRHDDLLRCFSSGRPRGLRCVVLSACHGEKLVNRIVHEAGIDHAVGFRGAIGDLAARSFSIAFHEGLRAGDDFTEAVERGGRAIAGEGVGGRAQIVVCSRPGASRRLLRRLPERS